ncbi:MAG: type 1 glutamine amidotransferase [Candidatus Coatesbacteria bacterium]|nr:MAG: type 1 glutamine amidotransferase [Candidatus Coatesbacteria bacterium]
MAKSLEGKRVAVLVAHGFEKSELASPKQALEDAGAEVHIISPERGTVRSWYKGDWDEKWPVDVRVADANPGDYDALVLPGGVMNPDKLRQMPEAVEFVRVFFEADKPVAAICHGQVSLVEAGVASGRRMTSYKAIHTDLENAGAEWVDEEVVVDGKLVTSRHPGDLEAFNRELIKAVYNG